MLATMVHTLRWIVQQQPQKAALSDSFCTGTTTTGALATPV